MATEITTFFDKNPAAVFYAVFALSLLLLKIPYLNNFFKTLNTLFHENGHALAAILLSGEVIEIKLNSNTSGSALTKSQSRFRAALVTFSGYPLAIFAATGLIWLWASGNIRTGFFMLVSLAIINLIFLVRNTFGIFWLITFSVLCYLAAMHFSARLSGLFFLFIGLIGFAEAIISTAGITFLAFSNSKKAGDMTILAKLTGLPSQLWAIITLAIVLLTAYYCFINFFPPPMQLFALQGV